MKMTLIIIKLTEKKNKNKYILVSSGSNCPTYLSRHLLGHKYCLRYLEVSNLMKTSYFSSRRTLTKWDPYANSIDKPSGLK